MFEIGDVVEIQESKALLDCCQGKRGKIVHRPAGNIEGWLLSTDHFCPIIRQDSELTLVSQETLAKEYLSSRPDWIVKDYQAADSTMLAEHVESGDRMAYATLVLRGYYKDSS